METERRSDERLITGQLILIVEDNEKNAKLARDVLQFHGYRTVVAVTAEEGIAVALWERPDLVLMDIHLPDMDGVAAVGRLRAAPETAGLRVVAFTVSVMEGDRERLLSAGFDGYLSKPIDVRAFPHQVRAYIEGGNASGQA
jgi:two-component system, cell cycle response regulator DivK